MTATTARNGLFATLLLFITAFTSLTTASTAPTAQTFTNCDPTNRTDCPEDPALGMSYKFDFTDANNASTWNLKNGMTSYGTDGAAMVVSKQKESPTLTSKFYIFFGVVEVFLKASVGQGIISSIVMESDDLDEIDWELIGGNETHVQTNYFGKGNTTSFDRAFWHPVENPMGSYRNYTTHWTKEKIEWFVDGGLVRTLNYHDALGGKNYPQTPMFVSVGIWSGGDVANNNKGTVEWAGGPTDFSKAPFTMYVQSVKVTDFSTGQSYKYGDQTGSMESIQIIGAENNSTAKATILAEPIAAQPTLAEKFNALPSSSKAAIYGGSAAAGALLLGAILFTCIKQRRQGRREAAAYQAKQEAMEREDKAYEMKCKAEGISADSLTTGMTPQEYAKGVEGVAGPLAAAAAGGMAAKAMNDEKNGRQSPRVPPLSNMPNAYRDGTASPSPSIHSPTGSHQNAYAAGGLRSPSAGPAFNGAGAFNAPRSPGPGGYSMNPSNASGGYFPAAAPNNGFGGGNGGGNGGWAPQQVQRSDTANSYGSQPGQNNYARHQNTF